MNRVVVIGSSGHAKVVINVLEQQDQYAIAGLIDDSRPIGDTTCGYEVLGASAQAAGIAAKHNVTHFIVAIGDNGGRARVASEITNTTSLSLATAVHPTAIIARDVSIGGGTVIMAGVIVNPATTVGEHCIINTRASIDHDNHIAAHVSVAPGVTLGGDVHIGDGSAIGIGTCVTHGIRIGAHAVIGAGSVVIRDVPANIVGYGVPMRVVRSRKPGDRYL